MSSPESPSPADNKLLTLRDRREAVIDSLSDGFANDLIDEDEFERRLDLAYQATTLAALAELVEDLAPSQADDNTGLAVVDRTAALVPTRPEHKRIAAIMSNTACRGRWTVPGRIQATSVMGSVVLDLREAILPPGVTVIEAKSIMGSIEIFVPPDVAVQSTGFALLGDLSDIHRAPAVQDDSVPQLIIEGFVVMGSIEVKTRLPGESGWQAWIRERRERKRLAEAKRQRALGDGS